LGHSKGVIYKNTKKGHVVSETTYTRARARARARVKPLFDLFYLRRI
jgi:hypothetical protein